MKSKIYILIQRSTTHLFISLKWASVFVLCLWLGNLKAQKNSKEFELNFNFTFNGSKLKLDSNYVVGADTFFVETVKFYVSGIQLSNSKNKTIYKKKNGYHLIDFQDLKPLKLNIPSSIVNEASKLTFNIGIDSITNVSGAMGGDLDPTKGMYWTWQSGYINFKIEGKSSLCKTRNNEFQFHLGGYANELNAIQLVEFPLNGKYSLQVELDLYRVLTYINLSQENHIMSPSKKAVDVSNKIAKEFVIK